MIHERVTRHRASCGVVNRRAPPRLPPAQRRVPAPRAPCAERQKPEWKGDIYGNAPHRRRRHAIRERQRCTGPPGACQGHLPMDQPVASSAEVTAPALRPPLTPPGASAARQPTPPPAPRQRRYVTPFPSPHGRGGWRHDGWPLTLGRGAAVLYGGAGARSRCRLGHLGCGQPPWWRAARARDDPHPSPAACPTFSPHPAPGYTNQYKNSARGGHRRRCARRLGGGIPGERGRC